MIMLDLVRKTLNTFPKSFINGLNELIVIPKNNTYFSLDDCENDLDVKCKLIEWCSRSCCSAMPYYTDKGNNDFHSRNIKYMNEVLDTHFSVNDMEIIYQHLGNRVNHNLTIKFIESGYDLNVLIESEE